MSYKITEAAPLEYFTGKLGKYGWPVIVHQLSLNTHYKTPPLILDGYFGSQTERIAKEVQVACKVLADGIVGPKTQEAFCKAKCKHAEQGATPPGLLAGLCNIEASYQWACVSPLNPNLSHDYGTTQQSLVRPTEQQLLAAFNPDAAAHMLAGELRGAHNAFAGKVSDRRAWELAALNHNWPSAAYAIATGNDGWLAYQEDWLTAKGYASGTAYCDHYLAVSTAQVTSWTVS